MGKLGLGEPRSVSLEHDVRKLSNHMFDLVYDVKLEHRPFVNTNAKIRRNLIDVRNLQVK